MRVLKNVFVLIVILLSGCTQADFLDVASRSENPVDGEKLSAPAVKSFEHSCTLKVEWESSDKAGKYLVYRDTSANGGFKQKVYEGESRIL